MSARPRLLVVLAGVCTAAASPSVVAHLTSGARINASNTLAKFSFAALNVSSSVAKPLSFALSDPDGAFGRLAWGEAQIGVQGGLIARKLLSLSITV